MSTNINLLKLQQVADVFGVHPKTISRWQKAGIIEPTISIKGRARYSEADLKKMLKNGKK